MPGEPCASCRVMRGGPCVTGELSHELGVRMLGRHMRKKMRMLMMIMIRKM